MSPIERRSLAGRMAGAAFLDVATYEDVEADRGATGQAALVVGIVAVASAVGGAGGTGAGFLSFLLAEYVGWLVWAALTYLIGARLLGGMATWGELLRTIGFAHSPGVLYVVAAVPLLGSPVRIVLTLWLLVAGFIAIRQALDIGNARTLLTVVLGWLAAAALQAAAWLVSAGSLALP